MNLIAGIVLGAVTPQGLVNILLAPFTVLGAGVVFFSGLFGAYALTTSLPKQELSTLVDQGVAVGFLLASPLALATLGAGLSSS